MKEKIKYVGAMLICFIAVLFIQMPVMADDGVPATAWRDNAAAEFAGGSGTKENPYRIEDGAQLAKIAKDVEQRNVLYKNEYFRLEKDIDLSAHRWNPIGVYKWYGDTTDNRMFAGFLDGNGKTITGLIVDERTEKNRAGLFGKITCIGTATNVGVKNLNIVDARIYATNEGMVSSSSAILAGMVMTNSGETARFNNISVSGTIVNTKVGNNSMISGGLIGEAYRVTADNCRADVTIEGGDNMGGFVGMDCSSTYTNCKVTGNVTGLWTIGGFVGYASDVESATMSTYDNCIAKVDIVASDWRAGGFAGYMEKGKSSSCAALGDVTSSVTKFDPKVGGFAGEIGKTGVTGGAILDKCYAAGKVTAASPDYKAGGFVGTHTEGTYTDCSFDSEKNPGLASYGKGDKATVTVVAGTTIEVYRKLCKNIYGGHTLSKVDAKEATHMTDGNIEYWLCTRCGSYFSDAGGKTAIKAADVVIPKTAEHTADSTGWHSDADNHWNTCECGEKLNLSGHSFTWVIDKEATAEEKGYKHEQCTVCGYAKAAVEIKVKENKTSYAITEGTGSSYAQQSGSSLTVRGNGDFSKFTGIKVDGVQIGADNYEAKSGSTIITLKSSYLDTLTVGTHSIEILWTDGSASTAFTIQQRESQNPQSVPQNNTEQTEPKKNESPQQRESQKPDEDKELNTNQNPQSAIPKGKYQNKEQIRKNSVRLISKASMQWTKNNYLRLRWGRVKDADGYEVYLRKCDRINIYTKVKYDITNNKQTSLLVKKLNGKKLLSTFDYKYAVRAYKKIDGKKVYIGKTLTYHSIGSGNKRYTNPKKVTVKNAKMTLGVKKSVTIKAVVTKVDATLALMDHESKIRYVSSNPKIAKVDMKTGKVTGLKKGKCTIYCIAINGVSARVEVTIK